MLFLEEEEIKEHGKINVSCSWNVSSASSKSELLANMESLRLPGDYGFAKSPVSSFLSVFPCLCGKKGSMDRLLKGGERRIRRDKVDEKIRLTCQEIETLDRTGFINRRAKMNVERFIAVGENIHCTRIYKVGGKFCTDKGNGQFVIAYRANGEARELPVPDCFTEGADWQAGKVKHCAVAIWQGNHGDEAGKAAGIDYLRAAARNQEAKGATYLDINVDEFSTDVEERMKLMKWTVETVQEAVSIPMSIDSSNIDILKAGLDACNPELGRPMVNSVSLERIDAVAVAREFNAVVIASAAGESGLPSTTEERMANIDSLMEKLDDAGFEKGAIHVDPLVFPISTDGQNGNRFLATVSAIREKYGPEIHIVAGLSNISFGMPKRKLINQVYTYLAVEAGADGGIVDPIQINKDILNSLDTETEAFRITKALLVGEDDFGMNYITAARDGSI